MDHLGRCMRCRRLYETLQRAEGALAFREPSLVLPPLRLSQPSGGINRFAAGAFTAAALVAGVLIGAALSGWRSTVAVAPAATLTASAGAPATAQGVVAGAPATCSFSQNARTGGRLQICPGSARVGETVALEGTGCLTAGADAVTVVLRADYDDGGVAEGTFGAYQFPPMRTDADGRFRVRVTIPVALGGLRGEGGGPVRPGDYRLESKPPLCSAPLVITE